MTQQDQDRRNAPAPVRIDKWLWAARFFKTRVLAQKALAGGKVKINGERAKPSYPLKIGDALNIRIGACQWAISVCALSARRGPAAEARQLYRESEASRAQRMEQVAVQRAPGEPQAALKGRPTKRERRRFERLRQTT